ncbi:MULTISPECIES: hypothetical protein [unclassified Acinetobacter]|uniref:hypothetical protein n=1 Tax=unclassified Acinetobacter TaxID=196816 RepID=UPI0035BAD095
MSIPYHYVEIKTFNELKIGNGSSNWTHWGVMDHEGVTIQLRYLIPSVNKWCYLPANILKKLYFNFDTYYKFNGMLFFGRTQDFFADKIYEHSIIDDLYESKLGFACLNMTDETEGYPYLLHLLPELNDREFLESLTKDPTLDVALLSRTLNKNKLKGNVINKRIYDYRHPRWSIEWLEYCENLVSKNPELKILDRSNFLRLPE